MSQDDLSTKVKSAPVTAAPSELADERFSQMMDANAARTSRVFAWLMGAQWALGVAMAIFWSPLAWAGRISSVHLHVWVALLLGGALSAAPIALALTRPAAPSTRFVISVAQVLWSALLIHLSGGRIETHFHVFGSLAFISFYKDWRVLVPATIVVAADHLLRGLFWPESAYGISNPEWWRFIEHALWVAFEDIVLVLACLRGVQETRAVAEREADSWSRLLEVNRLNAELDRRVGERTEELSQANDQLRSSLSSLEKTQRDLVEASRKAGMADVATAVLHNVGNVLNSVNVSFGVVSDAVKGSKAVGLTRLKDLLGGPDLAAVLGAHQKGKQVTEYVGKLDGVLQQERAQIVGELAGMRRNIDHIRAVVTMQQTHARDGVGVMETLSLAQLGEEAISMAGLGRDTSLTVATELAEVPSVLLDRHKVFQVVMNLLTNARHAIKEYGAGTGTITVRVRQGEGGMVRLEVADTGCGIASENQSRIFNHGFTTRAQGHGFGLHSSACAAMEMGGRLTAQSAGPGQGATFILELPARQAMAAAA